LTNVIQFDWHETLNWLQEASALSGMPKAVQTIQSALSTQRYGDLKDWMQQFENLPDAEASMMDFNSECLIGRDSDLTPEQNEKLRSSLQGLIPWRKGPINLFGVSIDTEWRSDWKWQRVAPYIKLADRTVLDVGCGNGYHMWRALAQKPKRVVGIDPSPRFVVQFYMLKKYYSGVIPIDLLPIGIEDFPDASLFDTVLSMGVLYHRRSPMDHLVELFNQMRPGGQLVLETLVIEGDKNQVLLPNNRYAKMPNVWFIPSVLALQSWVTRAGFLNVECIDVSVTSLAEQRSTQWMKFHSLKEFLDPENQDLTVEGYPRPRRAMLIANRPE